MLMCRSSVFLLKQVFPQFMVANVLATTAGQGKLKNRFFIFFKNLKIAL